MIKALQGNPILIHQMRHARWPSMRTAVRIAAGLTVIGLALTITNFINSPGGYSSSYIVFAILMVALLLLLLGALITAVVAVMTTVSTIKSDNFRLLHLTQLPDHKLVAGIIAGVLFRLRALWMIAAGLMPPMMVILLHIRVSDELRYFAYGCNPVPTNECIPPALSEMVGQYIGSAIVGTVWYAALFIGGCWLAVTLGVRMGFRYCHTVKALAWTIPLLIFLIAVQTVISGLASSDYGLGWQMLLAIMLLLGIDIAAGWMNSDQTTQHVRKTTD